MLTRFLLVFLLAAGAFGQGIFSSTARRIANGATIPPTCNTAEIFFTTGDNVPHVCGPLNTWAQFGSGSGSTNVSGTANQITVTGAAGGPYTISLPSAVTLPGTLNKLTFTAPATGSTLTIVDGKVFTVNNTVTVAGVDGTTLTFQGTDTYVGRSTTDTLANKTFTTPTISATGFVNANHAHAAANSGGQLGIGAILAGSLSGNGTKLGTISGSTTSGKCLEWDANGNVATAVSNAACGAGGSGGSVFTGSTASTISSGASPVFSLADVSVKSPIRFEISPVVNVTAPTITNPTAGAKFDIAITTDGTHTWSWNGIITDNVCPVYSAAAATTVATIEVGVDGSTLHGLDCHLLINGLQAFGPTVSAPSVAPGSGNMDCRLTVTGFDCLDNSSVHHVLIVPDAARVANQFVLRYDPTGARVTAAIAAADLPNAGVMTGDVTTTFPAVTVAKVNGNTPVNTCTNQFTRSIDSSARGTCASVANGDIAANAVSSPKLAVVNTRRVCDIGIGNTNGSAIANGDLGPQKRGCFIPYAATVVEVDVSADAGTPNVIVGRNVAGTQANILSSALATAASGGIACSNTGGTTGIDGATTCSSTLQNTALAAGSYLELVSGTAGGTAKWMAVHVVYTVD